MTRLGLCCKFADESISFRIATAAAVQRVSKSEQLQKLSQLCLHNVTNLEKAIERCSELQIGAFRILSQLFPLKTHPTVGYQLQVLPDAEEIAAILDRCKGIAERLNIRLLFHPDQFVVLNSPKQSVRDASLQELLYQAELAEMVGADVLIVHGGGAYGDPEGSLKELTKALLALPSQIKSRLVVENDDKTFSPAQLLPVCEETDTPLVYDVHHHRCLQDNLDEESAFVRAKQTWNREPVVHLSSPLNGWEGKNPLLHHDYIEAHDIPTFWRGEAITIEIEAKAKEPAVLQVREWMKSEGWPLSHHPA
jgi:UV DNA damage endonuclease